MKRFVMLILAIFLMSSLFAQEKTDNRQARKDERLKKRELLNKEMEKNFQETAKLLDGRSFVLQADFLSAGIGSRVPVTSMINFIAVDSLESVIQVGSPYRVGINGVGGVTATGAVADWKFYKDEKGRTMTVYFNVLSPIGIYDVMLLVDAYGNATATLTSTWPGRLYYYGKLVPLEDSNAYQGQTHY